MLAKVINFPGQVSSLMKIRSNKIHRFQANASIHIEVGPYILKTITEKSELIEALRLRYQVFYEEFIGVESTSPYALDVDSFDSTCDHLAIIDKKSAQLIGTYRLNCSRFNDNFYSATEFRLHRILEKPGVKVELGRACIKKDFRKGIVIALLWKGIAEYMKAVDAQLLFGCGSIKTESPREAALLTAYFRQRGLVSDIHLSPPTSAYKMPTIDIWNESFKRPLSEEEVREAETLIPSLLKGYLKAGAMVCGEPAYDREFKCVDFLTLLDRSNLSDTHGKKFGL